MERQVIRDEGIFRAISSILPLWIGAAFLVQALTSDGVVVSILSGIVGLAAAWVAFARFFFAGVYISDDRVELRAWFRRRRIERGDVDYFFQGEQKFDKYLIGIGHVDGSRTEFKVPIRATRLGPFPQLVATLDDWCDPVPQQGTVTDVAPVHD